MADSTLWWLLAGAAVAVELLTGTFYLLMLGIGVAAGALAAHAGAGIADPAGGRPRSSVAARWPVWHLRAQPRLARAPPATTPT